MCITLKGEEEEAIYGNYQKANCHEYFREREKDMPSANGKDTFLGYVRPDGSVGIRNYVVIIPSVVCTTEVAHKIKSRLRKVVTLENQYGCAQVEKDTMQTLNTLAGLARNPNVAAALVIGLGCETLEYDLLTSEIAKSKKPVEFFTLQDAGGTRASVKKGIDICRKFLADAEKMKPEEVPLDALTLATECGGSDAFSGLTANPSIGVAADMLVERGARVILSETPEIIGAEHILAKRAVNSIVSQKVMEIVHACEDMALEAGVDIRLSNPAPGNRVGGITTLEEKSLGCIYKGGTTPLQEVVMYGETPTKKGLVVMDTPGYDIQSLVGMAAGGAQVAVFSTGRGTPTGSPIMPVIKISSNTRIYKKMKENIDINAGAALDGKASIQKIGEKIFKMICSVARGKKTAAERLGHCEFGINRIGPTF